MTLIPLGAQLGPIDLPPPPPASDPREPSPTNTRGRTSRTPQRARSPAPPGAPGAPISNSRGPSPSRPGVPHHGTSDSSIPLVQPVPKSLGSPSPVVPINPLTHHSASHISRRSSFSSIHSSSSMIFERDIEVPAVASLSLNPNPAPAHPLNHKTSRLNHLSHGSPLDHSVPAALDDAVEALAGTRGTSRGIEGLEIEAPAPSGGGVNMARQSSASLHGVGAQSRKISIGQGVNPATANLNSRSPSPVSVISRASSGLVSPARSPPILAQLGTSQQQQQAETGGQDVGSGNTSPTSLVGSMGYVPRPAMPQRISTGPQVPGGWASAFGTGAAQAAPASQDQAVPKADDRARSPADEARPISPVSPPKPASPSPAIPSHLTPTKDKRRISFISYNDLLLSVPTQVTSLNEITSGVQSPDHLPGTVSPNINSRSPVVSPPNLNLGSIGGPGGKEVEHKPSWDHGQGGRAGGLGLGDGEWGREGLGKGLEQRLEDLVREEKELQSPAGTTAPAGQ